MPIYHARSEAAHYGHAVGMIVLDCVQPNIPGDVANASTFRYPVLYRVVQGLTTQAAKSGDLSVRDAVIDAARELQAQGVKAIGSNCGFLLYFQDAVADAVSVPVVMSSLIQIPMILTSMPQRAKLAIITADAGLLGDDLLRHAAGDRVTQLVVAGLQDSPEFRSAMRNQSGRLDSDRLRDEVIAATRSLLADNPDVGSVLLECAVFPPYSAAVQAAVDLPVFDFVTLIDWAFAGTHQRSFDGLY